MSLWTHPISIWLVQNWNTNKSTGGQKWRNLSKKCFQHHEMILSKLFCITKNIISSIKRQTNVWRYLKGSSFVRKEKKASSFFWKENLKQGVKLSSSFFSLWQILTRQARKKKICMEVWGVRRRHLTMAPPFETHTVVWFNTLTKPCLDKLRRSVFASISNLLWSSFVIVVPQ